MKRDRVGRGVPAIALLLAVAPAAAASGVGLVVAVHGRPVATDAGGHWRPPEVLQDIHDGETLIFDPGDVLIFCSRRQGDAFKIEGPGTVSIGETAVAVLAGSPRVTRTGPCDDDTAADGDGGVILRSVTPRGRAQPAPGTR